MDEINTAVALPPRPIRHAVIVGDPMLTARLRPLIEPDGEVTEVDGFLAAMGEAGGGSVDAVIGPAHALSGMAGSTAEALRRLAPGARLLLTYPENDRDAAREALASGFDGILDSLDTSELVGALGLSPVTPAGDGLEETDTHTPRAGDRSGPLPGAGAGALPGTGADEALGDTDLVEAVLRGRGEVTAMALRLAMARSGLTPLAIAPPDEDDDIPDHHATAALRFHGIALGTLHAPPPATADLLTAWAQWLARWLSLDQQFGQLRDLSLRDELTGVWNRRYFNRFLTRILQKATDERQQVTLMVFDIDDFKHYNDTYGHPAGDEILREIARLMQSTVREHDVVARIGGDEFAVIFWDAGPPRSANSSHPHNVLSAAKRFQKAVCEHRFPKLLDEAAGSLTISAGLAGFPWDGRSPDELLEYADQMALRSKQQGKNAISFGPHTCYSDDAE